MAAPLRCPACGKVLATRRRNGTMRPETTILVEAGAVVLICPDCGRRFTLVNVSPVLVPI